MYDGHGEHLHFDHLAALRRSMEIQSDPIPVEPAWVFSVTTMILILDPHPWSIKMDKQYLVGGWAYPSEKYDFASWDHDIPNIWKNNSFPKHQPGMIKVPTAWGNNLRFLRDGGSTSLARDGSLNLDWLEMRRCSVWFDSIVSDPDFFHESTLCGGGLAYSSITLYQ